MATQIGPNTWACYWDDCRRQGTLYEYETDDGNTVGLCKRCHPDYRMDLGWKEGKKAPSYSGMMRREHRIFEEEGKDDG